MKISRNKIAFGLIAAFALLAISTMLGHPIVPAESLAALGMAPALLGSLDRVEEIKGLIEKQGNAWQKFADTHKQRLDAYDQKFQDLDEFIAKMQRPGNFMGGIGSNEQSKELKHFIDFMRTGRESPDLKAMTVGVDSDGGYLVPEAMDDLVTRYLRDANPMRQLARVVRVGTGEFKQIHSRGGTEVSWVGEIASRPTTTGPTVKAVSITVHEAYCSPAISQTLLDDAMFDVGNWIAEEIGEAFADAEGDAFCNGNGVARPRGLFTYDVVTTADETRDHEKFQYVKTGASGGFHTDKADPLIRLVHAVKPAYRRNASWLMHPEVFEAVRLFKEATSDKYIFEPSLQAGQPDRLLGYPVYQTEDAPAIAANSLSAAFGDFSRAYTIVDRKIAMMRDPYTSKPYVLFYANKRVGGGGGRDTRAVKFLKFGTA